MKRLILCGIAFLCLLIGGASYAVLRAIQANTPNVSSIPAPMPLPVANGFDDFVEAAKYAGRDDARSDALLHRGFMRPCVYPSSRGMSALATQHPFLPALRALGRHLRDRALASQKVAPQNPAAWAKSLMPALDAMELGTRMSRGGSTISSLAGDALVAIGNDPVEAAPFHVDALAARASAQRIEKILAARPSLVEIITEDKYGLQSAYLTNIDQTRKRMKAAGKRASMWGNAEVAWLYHQETAAYDQALAQCAKSYALRDKDLKSPLGVTGMFDVLQRFRWNEARTVSTMQLLEVRFALHSYRLRSGSYPTTLQALVPSELQQVPADAFGSGEAVRYRRTSAGYLLWSIGPDAKDDGGRELKYRKSKLHRYYAPESAGDVVFTESR